MNDLTRQTLNHINEILEKINTKQRFYILNNLLIRWCEDCGESQKNCNCVVDVE